MILWLVLAAFCMLYGILVMLTSAGTRFHLVWFGGGLLFLLLAAASCFGLWSMLPAGIRLLLLCLLCVAGVVFLLVEGFLFTGFRATAEPGLDYLIVLGAQMKPRGPSRVLRFRLDRAVEYLETSPDTICIVSGGQGRDEPCSEAAGMAAYLREQGISSARILQEWASATTEQNIAYSMQLIPEGAAVGIVTNNFHICRAMQIARRQGLRQAKGIAAYATPLYLPNNMLREFFSEMKYLLRMALGFVQI